MACPTCPQSGWPPASARARSLDTRLDTVSADQFLPRTPALAGRATDMADLSTVRSAGHPQFEMTAQPMGGPDPDGGGQPADTSNA
jgi:hypothetical protein